MRCPVDDSPLDVHQHGVARFASCARCRGLWFERGHVLAASARDPSFALPAGVAHQGEVPEPTVSSPQRPARRCADCGERLRRRFVAEVELDVCPRCHGLWLDRGEFEAVRAWYAREKPYLPRGRIVPAVPLAMPSDAASGGSAAETAADVGEFVVELAAEGILEAVFAFIGHAIEGLFDSFCD